MKRIVALSLALVLVALIGCEVPQSPTTPARPPKTEPCQRPVMLAFTASWCGPCKAQKPLVAEIEAAGVDVRRYDIDEDPAMARQYGVTAVPTYIFYLCGRKPLRTNDATEVLTIIRNGWGCR